MESSHQNLICKIPITYILDKNNSIIIYRQSEAIYQRMGYTTMMMHICLRYRNIPQFKVKTYQLSLNIHVQCFFKKRKRSNNSMVYNK